MCYQTEIKLSINQSITCFTPKKEVYFELKSQCFVAIKGLFWAEKSVFCREKGGHFQTGEQGWVPFFSMSEGVGAETHYRLFQMALDCVKWHLIVSNGTWLCQMNWYTSGHVHKNRLTNRTHWALCHSARAPKIMQWRGPS